MLNKFIFSQEEEDLTHTTNLFMFLHPSWMTYFWLLVKGEMYGHVDVSFCFVNGQNNNFPFDFVHTQMLPHVYGEPGPRLKVGPPFLRVKQRASFTMPR
jgi:hypothetical protein